MKKLKKLISCIVLLSVFVIVSTSSVFATTDVEKLIDEIEKIEYTEEFNKWLKLSEEEKEKVIQPRVSEFPKTELVTKNPLNIAGLVGSKYLSRYSLQDDIPNNIKVKNQMKTNSCWTFGSLASLESTLALEDYKNKNSEKIYDYSERHMEYSTSRTFKNGEINKFGFNRKVGAGGNQFLSTAYLTNGLGPISENLMPFENNEDEIDISQIQGKDITAQIYDTVIFPTYEVTDDLTEIKNKMKEYIQKYGAIEAGINGASPTSEYANNETGAIYCDNKNKCPINHDVAIIGWDDDFSKEKFNEAHRPKKDGAWIIKNSWGEKLEITFIEFKKEFFETYEEQCIKKGWDTPDKIPNDIVEKILTESGYEIQEDKGVLKIGDNGIMYISYEDVNIYSSLNAFEKASDEVNYDNIYQYNYLGSPLILPLKEPKVYMGAKFDKNTKDTEYLTEIALFAPETYTCKVYVNANGDSLSKEDIKPVELKEGKSETFGTGYHTIEFLNPIEIKSDKFAVVVEVEGTREDGVGMSVETIIENSFFDVVETTTEKCFWTLEKSIDNNVWVDFGTMGDLTNGKIPNCDNSIKAFTKKTVNEIVLKELEITTPPTKTKYIEGQDFDKTGMVVTGIYEDDSKKEITDYTIEDGNDLKLEQKEVTIKYNGKTVKQAITVEEKIDEKPEEKAETSKVSDAKTSVRNVKVYYFTDKNKKQYMTMDVTLKGIERNTKNDSLEYYYYLSSSSSESNIKNWIKIKEEQKANDKLEFTINTNDIENLPDVTKSKNLYIYIKEVAKKANSTKELIIKSLPLESTGNIDVYVDGVKQAPKDEENNNTENNNNNNNNGNNNGNNNSNNNNKNQNNIGEEDNTKANKVIPKAGAKITLILTIIFISVVGIIVFIKYKKMEF